MKAKAYAVHRLPGRVRFRIPSRRRDRAFFDGVEERLRRNSAITAVETNPETGSVLVHYTGETAALFDEMLDSDLGELIELVLGAPPVASRLRGEIAAIDRRIRQFTGGELDLGTLASFGLLAMAGWQLVLGRHPTRAVSLGWYATELLTRGSAPSENA
jgi:hypothetical protein